VSWGSAVLAAARFRRSFRIAAHLTQRLHVAVVVDAAFSQRDHVVAYRGHGDPALDTEGVRPEQLRPHGLQATATYPHDGRLMTPRRPSVIDTAGPTTRRTDARGGSRHQLGS
jgi:hypothetical protein